MTKRVRITIDLVIPSSIDGDAMEELVGDIHGDIESYRKANIGPYGNHTILRIIGSDWHYITQEALSP